MKISTISLLLIISSLSCTKKITLPYQENNFTLEKVRNGQDFSTILQKHINNAETGDTLTLPSGELFLNTTLTIANKSLTIKGSGDKETILIGNGQLFKIYNSRKQTAPLLKSISSYSTKQLDSKRFGSKNMMICFESTELFEEKVVPYKKQYCNKIIARIGKKLHLEHQIPISLSMQTTKLEFYHPQSLHLENMVFKTANCQYMLTIKALDNVTIKNLIFKNALDTRHGVGAFKNLSSGMSAIGIFKSTNIKIEKIEFFKIWYGILTHQGCNNILINNCKAVDCRHLNNTALGTDHLIVKNCVAERCIGGFDSHETAISSEFINCADLFPSLESKFRGRRDKILASHFEKGIVMRYDPNIDSLISRKDTLYKIIKNSKVSGGHSKFAGPNIFISQSTFDGTIEFQQNQGLIQIEDSKITTLADSTTSKFEALTIGTKPWPGFEYRININGLKILNKNKKMTKIGVYIPHQGSASAVLSNIEIMNFEKGIVLYGGKESAKNYSKMTLTNSRISNCTYGIFQQKFLKSMHLTGVDFFMCETNINHPEMLRSLE